MEKEWNDLCDVVGLISVVLGDWRLGGRRVRRQGEGFCESEEGERQGSGGVSLQMGSGLASKSVNGSGTPWSRSLFCD